VGDTAVHVAHGVMRFLGSLRQLKDLSNLDRKSGCKMRDNVHTTKLKCLDMESKAAKRQEQLKHLEDQVSHRMLGLFLCS
jgi:hypothetical protein